MWGLLRLPRFGGAEHANGFNDFNDIGRSPVIQALLEAEQAAQKT
jgi:hypothetical protein